MKIVYKYVFKKKGNECTAYEFENICMLKKNV